MLRLILMAIESLLQQIQPAVQKTAQAIAEVIGLEVEVADSNFIRIAGTGKYSENCGEIMNAGFVYNHVLKTGKMIMIEHPGFHILCQPCPNYKNCPEHTELAAPIIYNCITGSLVYLSRSHSIKVLEIIQQRICLPVTHSLLSKMDTKPASCLMFDIKFHGKSPLYSAVSSAVSSVASGVSFGSASVLESSSGFSVSTFDTESDASPE